MKRVPLPRLLPVTISMLAVLLVVKTGILVKAALTDGHYVDTAVVTQANAAGPEGAEAKKPANMASPPLSPPPTGAPVAAEQSTAIAKGPPPPAISDSEKALLQELRHRRSELEARESALAGRESLLIASQKTLDARVTELQGLRKGLEDLDAARRQRQEDGWQGLVKVYEAMKPRDAATIFNDLSMPVLLQVLNRMKEAKAAMVMAAMSPEKAREVTAELAQLRTGGSGSVDSRPAPPGSPPGLSAPRPTPAASPPPAQATAAKASPTGG
jgi:flagellar motility protein MotE (MotC chaperone)